VSQSMNMTTDRQYAKTLEDLLIMAEAEKQQKGAPVQESSPAATSILTPQVKKTGAKPKNGKPCRQSRAMSSAHSSIATDRDSSDASANSQKFASKLPNEDADLTLANLLATSKVDITLSKSKKVIVLLELFSLAKNL